MTEKRFVETISTGIITDTVTGKEYNCEYRVSNEFLELINTIAEENEQLKQGLEELKEIGDYQADRIKELQEFEDKVFDSLNEKIKSGEIAIEWGESIGADVGAMGFYIESLKQFKKELKE